MKITSMLRYIVLAAVFITLPPFCPVVFSSNEEWTFFWLQNETYASYKWYNAYNTIWAGHSVAPGDPLGDTTVMDGGVLVLTAGNAIHLSSGFSVQEGGSLRALIEGPETVLPTRGGDTPVIASPGQTVTSPPRPPYDAQPTFMLDDDGLYKVWWCSPPSGVPPYDVIKYSQAEDPMGPWSNPAIVFEPRGNHSDWDGELTCDPSVIKVNNVYYLYYTGYRQHGDEVYGNVNRIGVAQSPDGLWFTRMNNNEPIIVPRGFDYGFYGTGQTSVSYIDGYYYLLRYEKSQGIDGNFLMRATNPTFQSGPGESVEEWGDSGWEPSSGDLPLSEYSLTGGSSVGMAYIPKLQQFVLATQGWSGANDPSITYLLPYRFFDLYGLQKAAPILRVSASWTEGAGILSNPLGHIRLKQDCQYAYLDQMRSVGTPGHQYAWTWDLAFVGYDYYTGISSCSLKSIDYDGDFLSDFAVFRPSETKFHIKKGGSVGDVFWSGSVGSSVSSPIQGDFDGDGQIDIAVVTPNTTHMGFIDWEINESSQGKRTLFWGYTKEHAAVSKSDYIAVADYDGDGEDDIAVYRPSTGHFYVKYRDTTTYVTDGDGSIDFDWKNAVPAPADYDGDGVDDFAAVKDGNSWLIHYSSDGTFESLQLGDPDAVAVPFRVDFNADGIDDLAYWGEDPDDPADVPMWYTQASPKTVYSPPEQPVQPNEPFSFQQGNPGDIPVVGDWNGDGFADTAVVRLTGGDLRWYILTRRWMNDVDSYFKEWGWSDDLIPANNQILTD